MGLLKKLIPQTPIPTSATQRVTKGSSNAIRTTWTAPSTVPTAQQAAADVQAAFEEYPQEGQAGIDKGGWQVAEGSLESGKFRAEFTSGSGIFAKLLNGGQGFKDDVLVEIQGGNDNVPFCGEVRSSSRMGKSDVGVNQKRLNFFG